MADNLYHHAYRAALAMQPIALCDHFVQIRKFQDRFFRKVLEYEAIPPHQILNMGALAAGTRGARANAVNLDLFEEEFGQWRWFPLDNFQVGVYNPAGAPKWQLRNLQVGIDRSIIYRDPLLVSTEICTWEDERPAFEPLNFSAYALNATRIVAFGFRFLVTDPTPEELGRLKSGAQVYTIVPCSAPGPGTRR